MTADYLARLQRRTLAYGEPSRYCVQNADTGAPRTRTTRYESGDVVSVWTGSLSAAMGQARALNRDYVGSPWAAVALSN